MGHGGLRIRNIPSQVQHEYFWIRGQEDFYSAEPKYSLMRDKGTPKGKGRKEESSPAKPGVGTEEKSVPAKAAPLTAKEKIAANQKNKRRK